MPKKAVKRCRLNVECDEHGGVHGEEAETLRAGVEKLLDDYDDPHETPRLDEAVEMVDHYHELRRELRKLLDETGACDSLAVLEAQKRK